MTSHQSRVLVQIRDAVLKGEFQAGERLAEIPLSQRFGVSRTPVRLALAALEQEGLIEVSPSSGYVMRTFTARDIDDAIAVRGHLEGMAARLVAEQGVSRELSRQLRACLELGDQAVRAPAMDWDDYTLYGQMNDRFHQLIIDACGNEALKRALALNCNLPFAAPSSMLPMQSHGSEDTEWMRYAHRQHHRLVQALERGESARAQALAMEHTDIARMNLQDSAARVDHAADVLPTLHRQVKGRQDA
ncbi:MAG: GntR family transcriptional regulator [Pigmentiphaga sp.]|nr:GntR family transcriptional regulator [Pigmentiphaga sp.]